MRLQSQQQVQENADKNFSFLASFSPATGKFTRLADDSVRQVTLSPEQKYAMGVDIREYELSGNLDGKRYQDVYVVNPATGERIRRDGGRVARRAHRLSSIELSLRRHA